MLPELSPRLTIKPATVALGGDMLVSIVERDGERFGSLVRTARKWMVYVDGSEPKNFGKARQVVRFLNQLV